MVTNDLGACEWFVWDLRRSGLIDRGQLDQIVGEFLKRNPRAEAPALAEYLVQQNTLTGFQADRILNGKTQGLVLGPYVLSDAIGQGSMGQVYKATSKNDSTLYAIKVLPRRSMWNVRLARRQVRSFAAISHPSVVPFTDVGTAGGLHYLVWPLVEGSTLESLVQQNGRLNPAQTALVGVQVAQGLNLCHQNNIFHGLVKPSNIMVGPDGQTRILDFGIGSLLVENEGESLVDTMSTANTLTSGLDCASPESIMEPTNRTPAGDQYSLGCVLYYCLTGRVPFPEGSAVEKMMAHQSKEPESIREFAPDCAEGLAAVVAKLMAKAPEDRFSGTDEVVEALEPYLGEFSAAAGSAPALPALPALAGARPANSRSGSRFAVPSGTSGRQAAFPGAATPPRANLGLAPSTPPPNGRLHAAASSASTAHTAPPTRNSMRLPSRESFQVPQNDSQEFKAAPVELQLQESGPKVPAARKAKPAPVVEAPEPDYQQEDLSEKPAGLGTIGVVAAALLLMVLVFIGAQLLMN